MRRCAPYRGTKFWNITQSAHHASKTLRSFSGSVPRSCSSLDRQQLILNQTETRMKVITSALALAAALAAASPAAARCPLGLIAGALCNARLISPKQAYDVSKWHDNAGKPLNVIAGGLGATLIGPLGPAAIGAIATATEISKGKNVEEAVATGTYYAIGYGLGAPLKTP